MFRYLKGKPGQVIFLPSDNDLHLHGWCDSEEAGCPLMPRSLISWFVQLGQCLVPWKTKKQHIMSRLSAEVKYQ